VIYVPAQYLPEIGILIQAPAPAQELFQTLVLMENAMLPVCIRKHNGTPQAKSANVLLQPNIFIAEHVISALLQPHIIMAEHVINVLPGKFGVVLHVGHTAAVLTAAVVAYALVEIHARPLPVPLKVAVEQATYACLEYAVVVRIADLVAGVAVVRSAQKLPVGQTMLSIAVGRAVTSG